LVRPDGGAVANRRAGHLTEVDFGRVVLASAGSGAFSPVPHVPADSLNNTPWLSPMLSAYVPTAVHASGDGHEIEFTPAWGLEPAPAGSGASTPETNPDATASGASAPIADAVTITSTANARNDTG